MWIMVFRLKEQFVQTDKKIPSFQIGTQLGLSSAAYSNISNHKLGDFSFSPDRPLKKEPLWERDQQSFRISGMGTKLLGWLVVNL